MRRGGPPPPRFAVRGRGGGGRFHPRGGRGNFRRGRGRYNGRGQRRGGGGRGTRGPAADAGGGALRVETWGRDDGTAPTTAGGGGGGGGDDAPPRLNVAVEGCCHGELDRIYARIRQHEHESGQKIDLLLCCGDFQSLRNAADFHGLAVPPKYRALGSFYRYYAGEATAPVRTVFIGGNHEASQPLQELTYGGWVAPNIYYLGVAGVIQCAGIRIGGISGIYKDHHYHHGRYEVPPYTQSTLRSIYHVREVDVYRLKCLQQRLDIMLSHDWPQGIEQHGDTADLLRQKPFFRQEVKENRLGSPANHELLTALQPVYWFSAHLHVKFKATVSHGSTKKAADDVAQLVPSQVVGSVTTAKVDGGKDFDAASAEEPGRTTEFMNPPSQSCTAGLDLTDQMTRFLSLDKCLPRRQYLSVLRIPAAKERTADGPKLEYDPEWLAVLRRTHGLTKTGTGTVRVPEEVEPATEEEINWIRQKLGGSLEIPDNFVRTVPAHAAPPEPLPHPLPPPLPRMGNPQTDRLLDLLELDHIVTIPWSEGTLSSIRTGTAGHDRDENELDIDEEEKDENELDIDDETDDFEINVDVVGEETSTNQQQEDGRNQDQDVSQESAKRMRLEE